MQWFTAFVLLSWLFADVVLTLPVDTGVPASISNGQRLSLIALQASANVLTSVKPGSSCTLQKIAIRKEWSVAPILPQQEPYSL
jgi:hypothetical protein